MKTNLCKKLVAAVILFSAAMSAVFAQNQVTTSGTVSDEGGLPLVGVGVFVKGTTTGVTTDMDGHYSLSVKQGATLVFECLGYQSAERTAIAGTLNVTLAEESTQLDEVVLIGYGVQKRSSVTGSVSSVKAEEFANRTITSAEQALQGKTAGVQIISSSAAPGSSGSIRIRGYSSNGDSDPLYVVDGLRTNDISNIDPNDIESMEVLKDAASAAIYGAQAGNGVILITTKKAEKGMSRINYEYQITLQSIGNTPHVLNSEEYIDYMTSGNILSADYINTYYDGVTDTDWMDAFFETSLMQKHNISFMGANDKATMYASVSYLSNDGFVVDDDDTFERFSATVNASYQLKKWLKISSNNTFTKFHVENVGEASTSGSVFLAALIHDPLTPVSYSADNIPDYMQSYIDDGRTLLTDKNGNYYSLSPYGDAAADYNPFIMKNRQTSQGDGFVLAGTSSLDITPIKEIVFTSRLGYRYRETSTYSYTFPYTLTSENYQDYMSVTASSAYKTYWQWENFVNFTKTFFEDHNVNLMLGMSYSTTSTFDVTATVQGSGSGDSLDYGFSKLSTNYAFFDYQTTNATKTVSGGEKIKNADLSYFGRISYDYKDKYFFQFTMRADAADLSILPLNKRWGYFPAVSLGWVASRENFMQNLDKITHLKVRASWGQNGSIAGLSEYMYDSAITSDISYPMTDDTYSVGSYPSATGNYDLKWETSEQIDLGLDLRMFSDRLSFSMDWYNKKTKDLIMTDLTPSYTIGNTVSPMNAGNIVNRGFEFELGWQDRIGDFSYSIKGNIATLHNEVTKVSQSAERIAGTYLNSIGSVNYFEEGYPVWYMRGYIWDGVDSDTGDPILRDLDGDGELTEDDQTMIGSAVPDFTYGITLTAAWKGFDLVVFGSGSHGSDAYLAYNRPAQLKENFLYEFYDGYWQQAGDNAKRPRPNCNNYNFYLQSTAYVFSTSYFKIKQIQLGYTLPKKLLRRVYLENLRVYASLDDFFTFTNYPGFDPEFMSVGEDMGFDEGSYPGSKKIVFGINLTF